MSTTFIGMGSGHDDHNTEQRNKLTSGMGGQREIKRGGTVPTLKLPLSPNPKDTTAG